MSLVLTTPLRTDHLHETPSTPTHPADVHPPPDDNDDSASTPRPPTHLATSTPVTHPTTPIPTTQSTMMYPDASQHSPADPDAPFDCDEVPTAVIPDEDAPTL